MKFQLINLYLCIWSVWSSPAFAAEPGAQTGQAPALPMSEANASRLTDIHDIKPALAPGLDLRWLYWALAIAAVLGLLAFAWRMWRKRKKPAVAEMAPPPMPAETQALEMLDALAADGDLDPKQFYFRLSAILRRYIERRYAIPAAEMTTEELLPKVDRLPLSLELAQPLKAFCRQTDPIKFAGVGADPNRMAQDMAFAREFVHKTTEIVNSAGENQTEDRPFEVLEKTTINQLPLKSENDLTKRQFND
jgi:hypothetical protein